MLIILLISILASSCSQIITPRLVDNNNYEVIGINDGILRVKSKLESNSYNYINKSLKLICESDVQSTLPFSEDLAFVVDKNGNTYYIDIEGEKKINDIDGLKIKFGDIFRDGFAVVLVEGEFGNYVIDKNGNIVLEPTEISYAYHNLGQGIFERTINPNNNYPDMKYEGIVDTNNVLIYEGNFHIHDFGNPFSSIYTLDYSTFGLYHSTENKIITNMNYLSIGQFDEKVTIATNIQNEVLIIDSNGKTISNLSEKYENIDISSIANTAFSGDTVPLNFTDGKNAILMDSKGNLIVETEYEHIFNFYDGIAIFNKNSLYGYIDTSGNVLIKPLYNQATEYSQGISYVKKDDKWFQLEF